MAGGIYPGGVSRRELEQRFRNLAQEIQKQARAEAERVVIARTSGGSSGGSISPTLSPAATPSAPAYEFRKTTAASAWVINHNLGYYPAVRLLNEAGQEIQADITHNSKVRVTATFSEPVKGTAVLG